MSRVESQTRKSLHHELSNPAVFRFEKLEVWQKAVQFADEVYLLTSKFPDAERFGLTSQMRRSAVSVSSNIAEGCGRSTDKEFARFVEIGYGSLMECVSQAHIAKSQGLLSAGENDNLHRLAEELSRMLSGLRNSLHR